jgi:hypothetical protein
MKIQRGRHKELVGSGEPLSCCMVELTSSTNGWKGGKKGNKEIK